MFVLHPQSGTPIYRQIVEQVRRLAASGQLPPGSELPSVRDVAMNYAVNSNTVSKAYSLLEAEGLLERNRGKPMTVAPRSRAASDTRKRLEQIALHVDQLVLAARQLGLESSDVEAFIKKKWSKAP